MKKLLVIFILMFFLSLVPCMVLTDKTASAVDTSVLAGSGSSCSDGTCKLTNPLSEGVSEGVTPQQLIGKIINAALGVVGSLALIMFIYGGFTWMLAAGNAEAVTKGKNIIIWATIGLVVIFSAYALVKFVISGIGA